MTINYSSFEWFMDALGRSRLATNLLLLVWVAGCDAEPALRPVSPAGMSVRVEQGEPPKGARAAGPIEASDGEGCAIGGTRGSLANATNALKDAAARRGAGFVRLTRVTKPYSGRDCYHEEYRLVGLAYYLDAPAPPPNVSAVPVAAPPEPPSAGCSPPCSSGYACSAGVCVPVCSPACSAREICRSDRVCVPAEH